MVTNKQPVRNESKRKQGIRFGDDGTNPKWNIFSGRFSSYGKPERRLFPLAKRKRTGLKEW